MIDVKEEAIILGVGWNVVLMDEFCLHQIVPLLDSIVAINQKAFLSHISIDIESGILC